MRPQLCAPTILPIVTLRPAPLRPAPLARAPRAPRRPLKVATAASLTRQHELCKFLSGGLAGALSSFFTTPLEVLRTRMQASGAGRAGRTLLQTAQNVAKDGVRGFYSGLGVSLVGTLPARSIYFATYARAKAAMTQRWGEHPLVHLVAAVAAGGTSNFVMSPLWVIRTRMQLGGNLYKGYFDAFGKIVNTEGVPGLYRGFSASLWGTSEAAIHFVLYERLKKMQRRYGEMTPLQYTLTAGVSKLVASVATYPHERVRVLMREVPKLGAQPKYRAMVQSLRLIAKEEGWKGLYRGMGVHLARTVPNTAIMFLSYELISKGLERRHRRRLRELVREEKHDGEDVGKGV